MCRFEGILKNNAIVSLEYNKRETLTGFLFEIMHLYIDNLEYTNIVFKFSIFTNERYATFDIDTHNYEDNGLGTFLLNSMLSVLNEYDLKFVAGKLSTTDYDNGNWKRSIPFYLNKLQNSFIIEAYKGMFIKNFYFKIDDTNEPLKRFISMDSFTKETKGQKDGYIICPLKMK